LLDLLLRKSGLSGISKMIYQLANLLGDGEKLSP
jgi:hypothetical protein